MKKTSEMNISELSELAKTLTASGMLPGTVNKWEQAFAIIVAGGELGLEPMRALRSLQVVKGKVVEAADSQLGRFKDAGGSATFETLNDTEAKLVLVHPNGKDKHVEHFTMQDAKRANLTSPVWKSYPKAMLRSRAITAGLKSVGWSGAAGTYDPDEAKEFSPDVVVTKPVSDERPSEPHWSDEIEPPKRTDATEEAPAKKTRAKKRNGVQKQFFDWCGENGYSDVKEIKSLILSVTGDKAKSEDSSLLTEEDLAAITSTVAA